MTKTKPLDKMTKPELVKALKAAQKRIAKLEARTLELEQNASSVAAMMGGAGPYDVVHVTQGPGALAPGALARAAVEDFDMNAEHTDERVPPAFPWEPK